ncbi:MAG: hypothetical protein NVV82_16750 [Sporocytophaga sp.]|nr:hypothetical protein [Sporocytophaga sp.]
MKRILFILTLIIGLYSTVTAQETFNWNDSIFNVGQTRNVQISTAPQGPCGLYPCYEYRDNKLTFDTLIIFLNKNKGIAFAFIWHTGTFGSSDYNWHHSKKMANGLLNELIRLGINESRIATIGLGESRPIISEEEIKSIKDDDKKFQLGSINKRIEIIITVVP